MPESNFLALIDSRADEIRALLPKYLTPERFFILAREVERNPQLRACTPQSLFDCVLKAAQCGLELGTVDQHCYIIPYKTEAQLQIGWRGMVFRLVQAGCVVHMTANLVREGDRFEAELGTDPKIVHYPAKEKRGKITHVYSVAVMPGGFKDFEIMDADDIDAIKKAALRISGGKPSPAWQYFEGEMIRKSVIRRHAKRLQGDRRGLMKDDEATRLDLTFAATNRDMGEVESEPKIPGASDGTEAPTPRRVNPEVVKPPVEDRLLNDQEQNDAFDAWGTLGGKGTALKKFLQEKYQRSDLAEIKLSELDGLMAGMQQELAA